MTSVFSMSVFSFVSGKATAPSPLRTKTPINIIGIAFFIVFPHYYNNIVSI